MYFGETHGGIRQLAPETSDQQRAIIASMKPMTEAKWIEKRKKWSPYDATPEGYRGIYLNNWLAVQKQRLSGFDAADKYAREGPPLCPTDAVEIPDGPDAFKAMAALPPGTKYCQRNETGMIVRNTDTVERIQQLADDTQRNIAIRQNTVNIGRKRAEDKYYESLNPAAKFFSDRGPLAKAVGFIGDNILPYVPVLGQIVSPIWQNFAPPGSKYFDDKMFTKEDSFGKRLGRAATGVTGAVISQNSGRILGALKNKIAPAIASRVSGLLPSPANLMRISGFGKTHRYKGGNLMSGMWSKLKVIVKGRTDYPAKVRKTLATIGNVPIRSVFVRRDPLNAGLVKLSDFFSGGEFSKSAAEKGYDYYFHLGLEIRLQNGTTFVVEKHRPGVEINPPREDTENTQKMEVDMGSALRNTIGGWLALAKEKADPQMLQGYDVWHCNCQDFVLYLLRVNNVMTPAIAEFTKQDLLAAAKTLPALAKGIGSAGTVFERAKDVLYEGTGKLRLRQPSPAFKAQLAKAGVSPSDYLTEAVKKANAKGLKGSLLGFSDDAKHKLQIATPDGKIVRFGAVSLGDYILYSLSGDPEAEAHRKAYLARATKIRGDWAKDSYSPNSLAIAVLW